jgi:hypothetical protein
LNKDENIEQPGVAPNERQQRHFEIVALEQAAHRCSLSFGLIA